MQKIYYDVTHPGGLGGINKLSQAVKEARHLGPQMPEPDV